MERNDSFINKLFDPSGRSGRLDFFLVSIVSVVLSIILVGLYTGIVNQIRRWHDLGKSGWWTLLGLAPLVSIIVYFYLLFAPGEQSSNAGE